MKKFRSFPIYSVGLAALSIMGTAQISQAATVNLGSDYTNVFEPTDIEQILTFSQTDQTIEKLTFTFEGYSEGTITLTNNAPQTQNVTGFTVVPFAFFADDIELGDSNINDFPPDGLFNANFNTGEQAIAANGGVFTSPMLTAEGDIALDITDPGVISLFQGGGTAELSCITKASSSNTGGGANVDTSAVTSAKCGAEIIATVADDPDPEVTPEASSLLGLSLIGGLGLLGAKSRKKQA